MPCRRATRMAGSALRTGECACRMSGRTSRTISSNRRSSAPHQRPSLNRRQLAAMPDGCQTRPEEVQAIDNLFVRSWRGVLRTGEVERLPSERALLAQNCRRAKRVPAVQRDRVVEDVEDAQCHRAIFMPVGSASAAITARSGSFVPRRSRGIAAETGPTRDSFIGNPWQVQSWPLRPSHCRGTHRTSAASTAARCSRSCPTGARRPSAASTLR